MSWGQGSFSCLVALGGQQGTCADVSATCAWLYGHDGDSSAGEGTRTTVPPQASPGHGRGAGGCQESAGGREQPGEFVLLPCHEIFIGTAAKRRGESKVNSSGGSRHSAGRRHGAAQSPWGGWGKVCRAGTFMGSLVPRQCPSHCHGAVGMGTPLENALRWQRAPPELGQKG